MRIFLVIIIHFIIFFPTSSSEEPATADPMITHPEWYINISDWSFYVAWGGVALVNDVTIENTSDYGYKNIKVRVLYYSMVGSNYGVQIGQESGYLPITLPPNSKSTYLRGGAVLGLGSTNLRAGNIQVLGAEPIIH